MITIESTIAVIINWHKTINSFHAEATVLALSICLELLKKGYSSSEDLKKVFDREFDGIPIEDFPSKTQRFHPVK
jgi:hypothetical protein